jgi:stringent starvation protein B
MTMSSSRPYIVRALYDWIIENDCTPYILVNAFADDVEVPQEHVKDGLPFRAYLFVLRLSISMVALRVFRSESMSQSQRSWGFMQKRMGRE